MLSIEPAQDKKPLVVILGPTAVGKSRIAIELARRFAGEIVSADSTLFYRGMDIGTSKPTWRELELVPHHLIDVTEPDQPWNLATFQERAHLAIEDIQTRSRLPFLVGGTGQYIRAVIQDWQLPRVEPDLRLRNSLEEWAEVIGAGELHRRLALIDPGAAEKIDPGNLRRTIRALEVIFRTGRRFSDQRLQGPSRYQTLMIGLTLPRPMLYEIIDQRIDGMIGSGLAGEVQALLERGLPPGLPVFSTIGYREIIAYLRGDLSMEEAVKEIRRATRILVRRQANWFKAQDTSIHWFDLSVTNPISIENTVNSWLKPNNEPNN